MPVCPQCGQINSAAVTAYHPDRATVEFVCERKFGGAHPCGYRGQQSVLGGKAKVGWKVDWALRWFALKVDYELYGKDLTPSADLSGKILRVLGGNPPLGFPFEMFLDEEGRKVSKSVGRGVTVDQWTRYAPIEVLKYFLLLNPRRARKLFLESIQQYVDDYLDALRAYANAPEDDRSKHPIDLVLQSASPRRFASELTFGLIMNLVSALGTSDRELIWNYLKSYDPKIASDPATEAMGKMLMECALNVYADFIEPNKLRYAPEAKEREHLRALVEFLAANPRASAEEIEKKIYDIGRENYDKPGKIFPLLYKTILGQERGPRLGAFIRLATPPRVVDILNGTLNS
jgi:lysyl-tRNA synthetase class 1